MKVRDFVLTTFLLATGTSYAGVFGASNYEECVLDKMKGQDRSMIYTARAACAKAFPQEELIDKGLVDGEWCKSNGDEQKYCITKVPKNYTLTSATALFFTEDCDAKQAKPGVEAEAKKDFFGNSFTFKTPYASYKCARFSIFGLPK